MKAILDSQNRPRCPQCGETLDTRQSCSCGALDMKTILVGKFDSYQIMTALGFSNNAQKNHHNHAAWRAANAWREANIAAGVIEFAGYSWDGYGEEMYRFVSAANMPLKHEEMY